MVALPIRENVEAFHCGKRENYLSFPDVTDAVPIIQDEYIVRYWPNHSWGPLLLKIETTSTPNVRGEINGAGLEANVFVKRSNAARKYGAGHDSGARLQRTAMNKRKPGAMKYDAEDAPSELKIEVKTKKVQKV